MQEVAWAAWEFAKAPVGDAQAFLEAYRVAGGPLRSTGREPVVPFLRRRPRDEIRFNLAAAGAARPGTRSVSGLNCRRSGG